MQATERDATLSEVLKNAGKSGMTLVIGNKNYSSWSMRPWVVLKAFGIPFNEVRILLDQAETATDIAKYSAAGKVPVLVVGDLHIWDSLAICEYLAEQFPDAGMWPKDVAARAIARSVCAEMHAGFAGVRSAMSMDIRASRPGEGRTPQAQGDIGRISEIWEDCLSEFGHHRFLFGDFSIADAFFAPVVMRFRIFGVSLAPALQAYVERVQAHPAIAQWVREALEEQEVLPDHL
ncbi:glutathione S-transferase family protein [Glaciimonas immobilis]|uniref:Glutathione S-transferase n=1 Tax=Glaciimonas immobilis TaxID=728004 RepID=A0A840S179_9BURK|nr:glutathione S-transferase family protein [Glaciimonas immobilis]KAF3997316.1 glutathione S-transferase family protein [Glaciimonas immobilis]MBB5202380.1 glutathione S-transferase [Glaciimonas immobilis]